MRRRKVHRQHCCQSFFLTICIRVHQGKCEHECERECECVHQGECECEQLVYSYSYPYPFALISRPQQPTGRDPGADGDQAAGGYRLNSRDTGLLGH